MKHGLVRLSDRIQRIPGLLQDRVGWQGIIPARPSTTLSISVDTGISRLATQHEFYETFDPDRIAQHILAEAGELSRESMTDLGFNEERSEAIEELIATRPASLPPDQYVEMSERRSRRASGCSSDSAASPSSSPGGSSCWS
ncbi:MAG: hypothetical protein ABEJ05_12980 [Haloglomus sp.]